LMGMKKPISDPTGKFPKAPVEEIGVNSTCWSVTVEVRTPFAFVAGAENFQKPAEAVAGGCIA
jgi:hypothetical protein